MFFVETHQFTRMQCQSNTLLNLCYRKSVIPTLRYSPVVATKKQSRNDEMEVPAKYSRFELEGESNSKGWDLSSGLASYLNKYMSIHVPEKDIREKILQNNPVPRNVKVCQRLDEYIKEFLLEGRKSSTLYHEKILKGIQEKIVSVLAPLTKLWSFMVEERELISPDNEASDGHQEIASLFEQTILLAGQVFNSVAYQIRLIVLNTLIDNIFKVKEILKPMLNLEAIDNDYLFGEKFEEQLSKITSAKQKSKSIFTGLQGKPNMMNQFVNTVNQPFRSGPLLNSQREVGGESSYLQEEEEVSNFTPCQLLQQRVEILSPQDYPRIHPVIKRLLSVENMHNFDQQVVFSI